MCLTAPHLFSRPNSCSKIIRHNPNPYTRRIRIYYDVVTFLTCRIACPHLFLYPSTVFFCCFKTLCCGMTCRGYMPAVFVFANKSGLLDFRSPWLWGHMPAGFFRPKWTVGFEKPLGTGVHARRGCFFGNKWTSGFEKPLVTGYMPAGAFFPPQKCFFL